MEEIHKMLESFDEDDRSFLELLIENEENPFSELNTREADPAEDKTEPVKDEAVPESLQSKEALPKDKNEQTLPNELEQIKPESTTNEIFPKETLPNEITGQNLDLNNETPVEQTNPSEMKEPFQDAKEIFQQIEPYETASEQTKIELEPLEPQEDDDQEETEPY